MLYAFDHLYMMGNRKLTRAKVLPDGSLGPVEFLAEMAGGGEHGPSLHNCFSRWKKYLCHRRKRNQTARISQFKNPHKLER